jgi:hypothetical protein
MSVNVDRSLELAEAEYFAEPHVKSDIALHHTARGGEHRRLGRSIGPTHSQEKPRSDNSLSDRGLQVGTVGFAPRMIDYLIEKSRAAGE